MLQPTRLRPLWLLVCALSLYPASSFGQSYTKWFLAEGATGIFREEILIGNPNASAAHIAITYLKPDGPPIEQRLTMAPTSRKTVIVNDVPGLENTAVSAIVESLNNLEIVVERSLYWERGGKRGGHNANGVTSPATRWYLAEGATGPLDTFVLIANPDAAADAEVQVTFAKQDGTTIVQHYTVPASSRFTVWVNRMVPGLEHAAFATVVESSNQVGIIVERSVYWGPNWEGGHAAVGVTSPSTTWHFAEGFTGSAFNNYLQFDTYLLLLNPSHDRAAVRVTYFTEGGHSIEHLYDIAPTSRFTIHVDDISGLESTSVSARVDSLNNVPLVAERAMYWGPGYWIDGHSSPGVTAEDMQWGFADGVSDGYSDTFFLLVNSGAAAAVVRAVFMTEEGDSLVKDFTVQPRSRFNIVPAEYPQLYGRRFATFLQSQNGTSYVAERAIYWGGDFHGGHGSTGTPWPGTIVYPNPPGPPSPPQPPPNPPNPPDPPSPPNPPNPPPNQPPNVTISATPQSGTAPLNVNFVAYAYDVDGAVVSYDWAFGDGQTAAGPAVWHLYPTGGSYTATVTVTDNGGATATTTVLIAVTAPGPTTTLKVVSWNVQFLEGTDGIYNPARTASWVASIDADLVALCELEDYEVPNLVNLVTQASGRTWYTHFVRKAPSIPEGNLILSKYPLVSTGGYFLSYTRSVARVTVNVGGRLVNFFATHLDHTSSVFRATEIAELTAWAEQFPEPRIIAGDFNAGPDTWEIAGMVAAGYRDSWIDAMGLSTATAYPDNPVGMHTRTRRGRIDHIYSSIGATQLTLLSAYIPDSRDLNNHNVVIILGTPDDAGVRPSDHNHAIATFEVR